MFGIECLSTKIAKAPVAVDHNHRGWHSSRPGQLGNVQSHDTLASATRDNMFPTNVGWPVKITTQSPGERQFREPAYSHKLRPVGGGIAG
jgi:hypothetical protein